MVKKTAKGTRTNLQRTREEQWRRRLAAQGGLPAATTGTFERAESDAAVDDAETTYVARSATARPGAATRSRTASSMSSATQRRQVQPTRAGRMKLAANTLSLTEEMNYVRSDIRRLIILTAICLAVLIALSFVIGR